MTTENVNARGILVKAEDYLGVNDCKQTVLKMRERVVMRRG